MKGFITFAMFLMTLSAAAVDVITDPVDVNITAHEADSLFVRYRDRIVDELNHVDLFTTETVANISGMTLTIEDDDAFSALHAAIDALNTEYEKTWASLDGTFVSLMSASQHYRYLVGDEGSELSPKSTAWKLTHKSVTTFSFSTAETEYEFTIEQSDKKFPSGVLLNLSSSKCLSVSGSTVTTSAPNPASPDCVWIIQKAEDPASLTQIQAIEDVTPAYDLLGRRVSPNYRGVRIAVGKKY